MQAINNMLSFIYNNWTAIITCLLLVVGIINKTTKWMKQSEEQKLAIVKQHVREIVLKLCSDAEEDYNHLVSAGEIKRSEVIKELYSLYPILAKTVDQKELIEFIDDCIDDALITLRDILETNEKTVVVMEAE